MAIKVAINGFGRIGRNVARAILERTDHDIELVSINDLASAQANAMLFQRDSVHGPFSGTVEVDGNDLIINGNKRATAGLFEHDYEAEGESIEHVGEVLVILGNDSEEVGRIRATKVVLTTFGEVPDEFALAEAEGDLNAQDFRESHKGFWTRSGYEITNDTKVVLLYFELI